MTSPEKSSPSKSPEKFNDKEVSSSDDENADDDELVNIWSHEDFSEYLHQNFRDKYPDSENIFYDVIFEQIKEQVRASTLSVQDIVNNRKNSFEFFGYDFMVDEDLRVTRLTHHRRYCRYYHHAIIMSSSCHHHVIIMPSSCHHHVITNSLW